MILAVKPDKTAQLIQNLTEEGISATCVGKFTTSEKGIQKRTQSGYSRIIPPATDPYWAAFFNALTQGLT